MTTKACIDKEPQGLGFFERYLTVVGPGGAEDAARLDRARAFLEEMRAKEPEPAPPDPARMLLLNHEDGVKVNPLKHYLSRKTLNDSRKPRGT